MDKNKNNKERMLVKGNEAIAIGAIDAGVECYFAYPITPQSDIPEYLSRELVKLGGEFLQAESEIASINMVLGAGACGKRAMTSSSSPGISLKQEGISYMAASEIPGVIVNITRGGPGLGGIQPSQGDYFQATRGGGHGDYRTLVLAPSTCQECYDLTIDAFDLAFKYRNPVLILGDAILGQMKEPIVRWKERTINPNEGNEWKLTGKKGRAQRILKSLYLGDGEMEAHNMKLWKKYKSMEQDVRWEEFLVDDAEVVAVAFGSIGRIAKSSARKLREKGYKVGVFRPITLFPFPYEPLRKLAISGKRFITIENNTGQMVEDVKLAICGVGETEFFANMPGKVSTPEDFLEPIKKMF